MAHDGLNGIAARIYYYAGASEIRNGRILIHNDLLYRVDWRRGGGKYFSSRGASFFYRPDHEKIMLSTGAVKRLFASGTGRKDIVDVLEVMRRQSLFMDAEKYFRIGGGAGAAYTIDGGVAVMMRSGRDYILQAYGASNLDGFEACAYGDFNPDGREINFTGAWDQPGADRNIRLLDSGVGRARSVIARIMGVTAEYGRLGSRHVHRTNGFDLLSDDVKASPELFYGFSY